MKIATFNVNGVKARLPALLDWLRAAAPDAAVLQEIKSVDADFPGREIEDLGYNVATHGQKGFNGVAILSKRPIEDVMRGLPGDDADEQARWIEATIAGDRGVLRLCGLYLPNGNPAPGPKYDYKIAWMERLRVHALDLLSTEQPVAMLGDYNVIPQPIDARRPEAWEKDALFLPETRAAYRRIVHQGWTDALRVTTAAQVFTFWDYQAGAFRRDDGIRIDHALLSPQAADRLTGCGVDRDARAGDKPSDHAPLWVTLDI
ncbi:MAG: exodeoxyribonuclease III [Rubrimonas sp.]